jgi:hypothetical protein
MRNDRAGYGDAWWQDRATLVTADMEWIDADTWRTDIACLQRQLEGAPLSA